MPLPRSTSVSKIIKFLKKEDPNMAQDQAVAIAYSHARKVAKDRGYTPAGLRRKK